MQENPWATVAQRPRGAYNAAQTVNGIGKGPQTLSAPSLAFCPMYGNYIGQNAGLGAEEV